ncbi:MAG: heterodisulfide reductase-related iron-sulfur binding cluster [Pseudomonadales bacterium]
MREGSLDAPVRHPLAWETDEFYDEKLLDEETRRVFDICHGCRRCFNLCDSFPKLFDLVDESESGELDTVDSKDFAPVVDACTMCDMCFMAKCPYVPPHEFDLDFPHLMLRHRAVERQKKSLPFGEAQMIKTDRNGKLGTLMSGVANAATNRSSKLLRPVINRVLGVHEDAELPEFAAKALTSETQDIVVNEQGVAFGRKAVLYATCYGNYNVTEIGLAARKVLALQGVQTEVVHPECCGMPQLEKGDIASVAGKAKNVAACFSPYIEEGYDVIALVPSCALMLKFEWPLIVPNADSVISLAKSSYDLAEYLLSLGDLEEGLKPIPKAVSVHIACHARAQNMGHKGAELLRKIPELKVAVVERCSGHGGSWGVMEENYTTALKLAAPVVKQIHKNESEVVTSECPLAGIHIAQAIDDATPDNSIEHVSHPIILLSQAYGL